MKTYMHGEIKLFAVPNKENGCHGCEFAPLTSCTAETNAMGASGCSRVIFKRIEDLTVEDRIALLEGAGS